MSARLLILWIVVGSSVVLLSLVPIASGHPSVEPTPSARVGAFYFDGWSGPLSNFHFDGLVRPGPNGQFPERRPLSGWRDHTREALQAQLRWAHAAGISFFLFDWYHGPEIPGNGPVNMAHDNYLKLADHDGVGFALLYVNEPPFGVSGDEWSATVEQWVTRDFSNPDYVRVNGKPLLVVYDTTLARQQWGGSDGVRSALGVLRESARRHGLPGVFVVGGRYTSWANWQCFPTCDDSDGGPDGLVREGYDALTEYAYPEALEPIDGARPFADLRAAKERDWTRFADASPVPWIPVVAGWDPRPWNERPEDHLFWFSRTPAELGAFLRDAIAWVEANPNMRLEAPPAPPVVLVQAWNELGEGNYVVPTDDAGYGYVRAIAEALDIPWTPPPKRRLTVPSSARGTVTSKPAGISCPPTCYASFDEGLEVTLSVRAKRGLTFDGWVGRCTEDKTEPACPVVLVRDLTVKAVLTSTVQRRVLTLRLSRARATGTLRALGGYCGCAANEPVQIQRLRSARWTMAVSTFTDERGRYTVKFPFLPGRYRATVPWSSFSGHTCLAAASPIRTRSVS